MLTGIRFAVIGRGTAGVLENSGIFPEIMPEHFNSQELGKVLAENISDNEKLLIMLSLIHIFKALPLFLGSGSPDLCFKETFISFPSIDLYSPCFIVFIFMTPFLQKLYLTF